MKKLISFGVGIALLASPLVASAQTASSNASLIAILTQLVQLLEQELQQLIAAQGGSVATLPALLPPPNLVPPVQNTLPPLLTPLPVATQSASLSVSPTSGASPLGVTFAITYNSIIPNNSLSINFGDGQTQSNISLPCNVNVNGGPCTVNLTHSYASAGTYTAVLSRNFGCDNSTASNPCGPVANATITVTATATSLPYATLDGALGGTPGTPTLSGNASGVNTIYITVIRQDGGSSFASSPWTTGVPVVNGRWSINMNPSTFQVNSRSGFINGVLPHGGYVVNLYDSPAAGNGDEIGSGFFSVSQYDGN